MSTYHCDKLCGNACCAALRWALEYCERDLKTLELFVECPPYYGHLKAEHAAACAVLDPAKLAELGAMALRARGVNVIDSSTLDILRDGAWPCLVLPDERSIYGLSKAWDVVSFRTLLAQIMAKPSDASSQEQCEKLIRGES